MRIGILSDIHDNIWRLEEALIQLQGTDQIWCLGDLCSPFVVDRLGRGFSRDIHLVFGNNDADRFRITLKAAAYAHLHLHGEFARLEAGNRRIALHHFDDVGRELANGGQFDVVCFGHNHQYEEARIGSTWLLNPGEIMGGLSDPQVSTCMILDLETDQVQKVTLGQCYK